MLKLIYTTICVVLLALNIFAQAGPEKLAAAEWREDLRYFAEQMPKVHKNLYFNVSKKDFEAAVAKLDRQIPNLERHEIVAELMRVTAMIGDAHTRLRAEQELGKKGVFPLRFYWFEDGLFVQTAAKEYENLIGGKIIKIGNDPANKALEKAGELPQAREDTRSLIDFVRENGDKYGIDTNRVGLWVFSGGGYFADLGMQEDQPFIKFIVAYYGIDRVETLEQIRKLGDKLSPVFMVRAGRDQPNLNNAITLFLLQAINRNMRITFVNYTGGQHSFDILDDTDETRRIIKYTYQFIKDEFKVD